MAREAALRFLASERERIMRLSRDEAIQEIIRLRKLARKIQSVRSVVDNGLLEIGQEEG